MNKRIALLADIHSNLAALKAVKEDMLSQEITDCLFLGDIINYGPHPNEVIDMIKSFGWPSLTSIWGNHEYSVFEGHLERFSTDRGRATLNYTKSQLSNASKAYLLGLKQGGSDSFLIDGLSFLCIHGTLDDTYWGSFKPASLEDDRYQEYDYVITGHSHIPHYIEHFYKCDNPGFRNKKRIVFINPGSVGQPRNHCPLAQYGILDLPSGNYVHRCVDYDIVKEQEAFDAQIDPFYKERLSKGI